MCPAQLVQRSLKRALLASRIQREDECRGRAGGDARGRRRAAGGCGAARVRGRRVRRVVRRR
jgi:hypothetical protein